MAKKRRGNGAGTLFKRQGAGPWIAAWYDHRGKRCERSTRTTDRKAAERILAKRVADVALRRDGVIDADQNRYSEQGRKALADHMADYIASCRRAEQAERHVSQKEKHLTDLRETTGASRLSDLTAEALERHLHGIQSEGKSARTVNFARQIAVAFASWCVKTGRLPNNPLKVVAKLDERKDRRRVRRALSDEELARLLAVAGERGRRAWYLAAALAGLRKSDLQRLTWADVDFDANTITIRDGKAQREDVIPMHLQLVEELLHRRDGTLALPKAKVFAQSVTDLTRQKDFLRAGLAREEVVTDEAGNAVMIGKGKRQRPQTCTVCEDAEGRVIDLHAMRTTLGTNLARAGVAPQLAQRIMRHSDYRTTLKHYTVLGLADTSKAMADLPGIIEPRTAAKATGTTHDRAEDPQQYPQQCAQQRERATPRSGATSRGEQSDDEHSADVRKSSNTATCCDVARRAAKIPGQSAGVTQLVECQPSKLNVAGSTPVARFSPPTAFA
jgi:integrase